MKDWYKAEVPEVLDKLYTDQQHGLTSERVNKRLEEYGPNEIVEKGMKSPWAILWEQLTGILVVILILAGIVSALLGEVEDTIVIMAIVVMNALLGFSQEYRAEQAIAALKKLAVPTVKVRRDGEVQEISARELVPGDIVLLEAGNKVPADGRIVESVNLRVEEAALTGESEPVEKVPGALEGENRPLGDRFNMVFMGTVITYGRGLVAVTETGMNTQLGGIAQMIQAVEREPTPLQKRLDSLGKTLAWITLGIIAVVFVLGLFQGKDLELMFLTAISLAVAAVPEGLPAVVTITLALGSRRMLKRNALIRKLPAVETLGSVTVICSDKTGTLTENRMTVTVLDVAGDTQNVDALTANGVPVLDAEFNNNIQPPVRSVGLLLKAAALCNDAVLQPSKAGSGDLRAIGDPTEGALVVAAAQVGIMKSELEDRWPRIGEAPFTSERKRMLTLHRPKIKPEESTSPWRDAPFVAFSKGAVDSLLEVSKGVWVGDEEVPLDADMQGRILETNARMAKNGQRVLGVAFRPVRERPSPGREEELEKDLIFIGLIGMLDPPRPEVQEAVAISRSAGIRPVMITGDHPLTALHIAEKLDITHNGQKLTGSELAMISNDELREKVKDVSVFARVSPEHKLNIVNAFQELGEVVAMTGDGVNDAPALKKADIGVAMGITGTDVSKEAADMVLLDDNFATIVAAVAEGRTIYDNIRKFIKYVLSCNTGEIWVMLFGPLLGMPLPLLPLQILWINLVTDGLPGLALSVEPAEEGTMKRSPFHPNESVFSRGIGRQILWIGLLMAVVSLAMGYFEWNLADRPLNEGEAGSAWQTMVFTTLTLAQLGNALATRSNRESLFKIGLLSNRPMVAAVGITFLLQLAVIYWEPLQGFFSTVSLTPEQLGISLLVSTAVFWATEVEKWFLRRRNNAG
jgi:Ca2+-transporting ATPase